MIVIIKITLTIIIIGALSLRCDHDLNYWSQLHRQITAPRSFSVLGTSVPTTNAHNDFFRARQLLWLQSLTKPIQDEKNQLLTTNIWLNLVSISKKQLKYSLEHEIAFLCCFSFRGIRTYSYKSKPLFPIDLTANCICLSLLDPCNEFS